MKNKKTVCIIALLCTASLLASCGSQNNEPAESTVQTEAPASVTEVSETEAVTTVSETSEVTAETSVSETEVSSVETSVSVSETSGDVTTAEAKAEASPSADNSQSGNINSSSDNTEKPSDPEPEPEPENGDATIELKGDSAECSSSNVSVNGSEVTIKAEGNYRLTGSLNGTIIVAAPKDAKVNIELAGVNISYSNGSAIRVDTADKVKIISAGGTENSLSDGGSSEACIFSKEDITLKGDGVIKVYGNVKNAVQSKNTLKVTGGTLEVSSPNNGLVGKDKVAIEAGQITINASRDAIKATNDSEAGKGVVFVTGGNINITAGDDVIQAISEITVNNCSISAKFEGKKANCTGAVNVDEGCITKIK